MSFFLLSYIVFHQFDFLSSDGPLGVGAPCPTSSHQPECPESGVCLNQSKLFLPSTFLPGVTFSFRMRVNWMCRLSARGPVLQMMHYFSLKCGFPSGFVQTDTTCLTLWNVWVPDASISMSSMRHSSQLVPNCWEVTWDWDTSWTNPIHTCSIVHSESLETSIN